MIVFRSTFFKEYGGHLWLRVPEAHADLTLGYLENLKGKPFQVKITKATKPRTTGKHSQNNHVYGHCRQISVETGNDLEMVYWYIKRRAMSWGYPAARDGDGNVIMNLMDDLPEPMGSAEASIEDANLLIEAVHQVAAERGINLIEEDESERSDG